jgi:von Willebrand factor type A domain
MLRSSILGLGICSLAGALVACSSSGNDESLFGETDGGSGGSSGTGASTGSGGGFIGSDASSNGGGDGSTIIEGPDGSCGASPFNAANRPANILLVIDRSGSMSEKFAQTDAGDVSRWAAMKSAIGSTVANANPSLSFGLELFPYSTDPKAAMCALPSGAASIQVPIAGHDVAVNQINTALASTNPGGGTPTSAALKNAFDYFTGGAGKDLAGDKFVLLATDGGPNCNAAHAACGAETCTTNLDGQCPSPDAGGPANCCEALGELGKSFCLDDAATVDALNGLKNAGIKTFVMGILEGVPGTATYAATLDQLAEAGGELNPNQPPKYFKVDSAGGVEGLTGVFAAITTQLIKTCEFQLQSEPPDRGLLNVTIDGKTLPPAGNDGWELISSDAGEPPTIVIKGATCASVQQSGAKSVEIVYGCPTVDIH